MPLRILLFLVPLFLFFASCKPEEHKPADDAGGTYFSIKQFAKDQWDTYKGQPYSLMKVVTLNGKTDSTLLSAFDMEWGRVFKIFFDTDISDSKYLGQYDFTMFEDNTTGTRNFYYEAKNEKLNTQKLQISADLETNKIRSVFIEAQDNQKWHSKTRKLFYMPVKLISIQEFEKSTPGPDKELRVEYRFF